MKIPLKQYAEALRRAITRGDKQAQEQLIHGYLLDNEYAYPKEEKQNALS